MSSCLSLALWIEGTLASEARGIPNTIRLAGLHFRRLKLTEELSMHHLLGLQVSAWKSLLLPFGAELLSGR